MPLAIRLFFTALDFIYYLWYNIFDCYWISDSIITEKTVTVNKNQNGETLTISFEGRHDTKTVPKTETEVSLRRTVSESLKICSLREGEFCFRRGRSWAGRVK